jgi:Flp pilus assembly protein TadG
VLRKLKSWFTNSDATVAIEFAMVGLPFIIMLIGIVEVCLFFSTAVSLEGATQEAARMIRTGQVQTSGNPIQTFENEMCQQISTLVNCATLQYQVVPIANNSFSNAQNMTPQFDASGNLQNQGFDPGVSSQDVLVRVVYQYTFMTPLLGNILSGGSGASSTLISTIVIQNEPYTFE